MESKKFQGVTKLGKKHKFGISRDDSIFENKKSIQMISFQE